MVEGLTAQLWKMVWLGIVGLRCQNEILFRYASLSKLAIDILAQLVRNTKIAPMLPYWPIGLVLVHGYALLNSKSPPSWGKSYMTFSLILSLYYVAQKCYQPLRKKIIGDQYQTGHSSYLFDVVLGIMWAFSSLAYVKAPDSWIGVLLACAPFMILLLA